MSLRDAIFEHPEFAAFLAEMNSHFEAWKKKTVASLLKLEVGCQPREVIAALSESLLAHYKGKPLVDAYDIYQHLMDYWAQTLQDDLYLIAADGWKAETYRIVETDKKGKEKDKGWACDLLPKPLIVARYFAKEQAQVEALNAELESVGARLAELEEEHGGEEGAFAELEKVNKASVAAYLKEIASDVGAEHAPPLREWLKLNADEAELKKRVKDAEAELDALAYAHYPKLSEAEVKQVAVEDKWLAALETAIRGEMDSISQHLTQRVKELSERYDTPMSQLTERVNELEAKVNQHLEKMGFSWK